MKLAQEDFRDEIDMLERTILNFHTWQDIKNHESVAQNCIQINNSLHKLQDEARKFNSRENLFDIKQSDYGKISTMVK